MKKSAVSTGLFTLRR